MEPGIADDRSGQWADPDELFVANLVKGLKKTRQWRLCGGSFRQLNKSWCSQFNRYIVEVHPHESRDVNRKDAESLIKFPNLSSLNATAFLQKFGDSEQLMMVDRAISGLTQLTHLTAPLTTLKVLESSRTSLQSLTSLSVKPGLVTDGFNLLTHLPLQELACNCSLDQLQNMMTWFPNLHTLEADIHSGEESTELELSALNALESLKLKVEESCRISLSNLGGITSLVSLHGWSVREPADYDTLVKLPKLKSLEACIKPTDSLARPFTRLLTQLTSLSLNTKPRKSYAFLDMPIDEEITLRSLTLDGFYVSAGKLNDNFSRLTHLSLENFELVDNQVELLSALHQLRGLSLYNIDGVWKPENVLLDHATLPNLMNLSIHVRTNHIEWMQKIGRLTGLESLAVYHKDLDSLTTDTLTSLDNLKKLREFEAGNISPKTATNLRMHIENWPELEAMTFSAPECCCDIASIDKEIRERFPHLKVSRNPYTNGSCLHSRPSQEE